MQIFGKHFDMVMVCWIIFLLYWFVSAFFVKKSVTKRGHKWILWRAAVIIIAIESIKFHNSYTASFDFLFRRFLSLEIIGTVLTVSGLAGAIWARIYIGRNWSGYVTYKEKQELVTTGPYRFVRHPIYASIILMFIGTVLYHGSLLLAIVFAVLAVNFIFRVKQEEKIMITLFEKRYLDYMKKTKRLIPWVY